MSAKFALVTGGAGFIGSHLVDRLVSDGWRVRVLDNFSSGRMENVEHHRGNRNVEIFEGDLKNFDEAEGAVRDVDVVFHYAANPEVRVSTTNPEIHFNENVVATFNLLEAMRRNEVGELVFATSSSVYGEPKEIPVGEEAPISPVSVYGASKAACENFIHAYSKLYGIRAIILRYANVVGPRLRHGVIWDYIDDAIEATLMGYNTLSERRFEVFNIGNEDYITVKEVADIVVNTLGLKCVEYVYKPVEHGVGWRGDVKSIVLSINRIKSLGFKPKLNSAEAVKKTILIIKNL
jgi:UDP-glucose 4-epimerase